MQIPVGSITPITLGPFKATTTGTVITTNSLTPTVKLRQNGTGPTSPGGSAVISVLGADGCSSYTPDPADITTPGQIVITATVTGSQPWSAEHQVGESVAQAMSVLDTPVFTISAPSALLPPSFATVTGSNIYYGNFITVLDAPANLTALDCNTNYLTVLDLTFCTGLLTLDCHANMLTALDPSMCTGLTSLTCNNNSILSLDVSVLGSLTFLNCSNNAISSLNLNNNSALTQIVAAYNPGLTTINLSTLTSCLQFRFGNCHLSSMTLPPSGAAITHFFCDVNSLPSSVINAILALLVAGGATSGVLELQFQSPAAPPTGQGITDKATLVSRSWNIQTD